MGEGERVDAGAQDRRGQAVALERNTGVQMTMMTRVRPRALSVTLVVVGGVGGGGRGGEEGGRRVLGVTVGEGVDDGPGSAGWAGLGGRSPTEYKSGNGLWCWRVRRMVGGWGVRVEVESFVSYPESGGGWRR